MTMDDAGEGTREQRELPDGLLKPGRMTTTEDPVMRKEAKAFLEKTRRRR